MRALFRNRKWLVGITAALIGVLFFFAYYSLNFLPRLPDDLHQIALSAPTEIYSDSGEIIAILAQRSLVRLSDISEYFQQAILALEDAQFYHHHGLNKRGLVRALLVNLPRFQIVQGGSSITQQLSKNLFFTFKRQWGRKIAEMLVAMQMESRFSKQEILEAYCNQISFGANIYGVELAAQTYFAKHADELTLAEAAFLASIPRSPSRYNPYLNFDLVKKRQALVLKRMTEEGFITEQEKQAALEAPLNLKPLNPLWGKADYFIEYVKQLVEERFGEDVLYYGGLKIQTTLDIRYQNIAQNALREGLALLDKQLGFKEYELATTEEKKNYIQGALVAIDPRNGKIKALIGGRDFSVSQFNRALANNRLPGSSFKPFVYLAAIDKGGFTPASVIVDSAVILEDGVQRWSPTNFDGTYSGPVILKVGLMKSINVVAARLMSQVGPQTVISYARKMGISSPLGEHLSLALGTSGVSPLEMASAYAVFANGGIYRQPQIIKFVESSEGKTLFEFEEQSEKVVDAQSIYLVLDMMKGVLEDGTASSARWWGFDRPAAGKTGTTNDFRDAWFIGFTPQLVTAVWVGFDDNREMRDKQGRGITGSRGALPIWTLFMKNALQGEKYRDFPIPLGIVFVSVDPKTGEVVPTEQEGSIRVALKAGTKLPSKGSTEQ
ncbi:MAG: PBP1A family penicillin-binding protein [candidate division KSB1 bacterium]|nr:PBP1A family penicillin-binding protein [candidate division KSB1 bacterium]